mgnify:FL=1
MQIRNVYGIDLGTSTVKIYDLKKDTITKRKKYDCHTQPRTGDCRWKLRI